MISSLRRRHRLIWRLLPFFIAGVLAVAWGYRRPTVVMDELPAALRERVKP